MLWATCAFWMARLVKNESEDSTDGFMFGDRGIWCCVRAAAQFWMSEAPALLGSARGAYCNGTDVTLICPEWTQVG